MKMIVHAVTLLALSPLVSMAHDCEVYPGELRCKSTFIDQLPKGSYGDVTLIETTVNDNTTVTTGNFSAKHSVLHDLDVTSGNVDITHTDIEGKIDITSGSIMIKSSKLMNDANISGAWINIKNTETKDIVFNSGSTKNICLNISRHSSINGNITFTNNQGLVYVSDDSKITGKINGGKIVKSKCKD